MIQLLSARVGRSLIGRLPISQGRSLPHKSHSRARVRDNSNPVQLFPFVAVLLCTMGSLLVILVVVALLVDTGLQQAAAKIHAEAGAPSLVDICIRSCRRSTRTSSNWGSVRVRAEEAMQRPGHLSP
jgi:hypothetical protein